MENQENLDQIDVEKIMESINSNLECLDGNQKVQNNTTANFDKNQSENSQKVEQTQEQQQLQKNDNNKALTQQQVHLDQQQNQVKANETDQSKCGGNIRATKIKNEKPEVQIQNKPNDTEQQDLTKEQILDKQKDSSTIDQNQLLNNKEQESKLTIVRNDPEKQNDFDDINLQLLNKIIISENILTDNEISSYNINSDQLNQFIERLKEKFDENQDKLYKNQENILSLISIIATKSVFVLNNVKFKDQLFLKSKQQEKESYLKQIQSLELESNKIKYYLQMMHQRLNNLEFQIDQLISSKSKMKSNETSSAGNTI